MVNDLLAGDGWVIAFEKTQFLCHAIPFVKQMINGCTGGQVDCY